MSELPSPQYHATTKDSADLIFRSGFRLPIAAEDVATHRYLIPTISTTNHPGHARVYHPSGVVIVVEVSASAKFLRRSLRNMRRGENLEDAVNRWILEARNKGLAGVDVGEGLQSTVGNQHLYPWLLSPVDIIPHGGKP